MTIFIWGLIIMGLLVLAVCLLTVALLNVVKQLTDMNKKLLILAMGREKNVDGLRALVASEKPPQGKLRGITTNDKKDPKPKNTGYTMQIGVDNVL